MFDWQSGRFSRPSDSLSSSLNATWHHREAPPEPSFLKWMNFQIKHWKKIFCDLEKISLFLQRRLQSKFFRKEWIRYHRERSLSRTPCRKLHLKWKNFERRNLWKFLNCMTVWQSLRWSYGPITSSIWLCDISSSV